MDGNISVCYNMDCMEGMAKIPDGYFDLAVVDPPYFSGPEHRGYYGCKQSKIGVRRCYYPVIESWEVPGKAYFDELRRVAAHYIVWGCNYSVGSCGINATRAQVSRIVSLLQQICLTACVCSGSCGTVCYRERAFQRGTSCRETRP